MSTLTFDIEHLESKIEFKATTYISTGFSKINSIEQSFILVLKKSFKNIKNFGVGLLAFAGLLVLLPVALTIVVITLPIGIFLYRQLAKKITKNKTKLLAEISSASFADLKILEDMIDSVLKDLKPMSDILPKFKNQYPFRSMSKDAEIVINAFKEFKEKSVERYTYSFEDTGLTEIEFKEYKKAMEGMSDVWDYASTSNEQELTYNHKIDLIKK